MMSVTNSVIEAGLFDGSFQGEASSNVRIKSWEQHPKHFSWVRGEIRKTTFFTDMYLFSEEAQQKSIGTKVAWILEPDFLPGKSKDEFDFLNSNFDYVLTSDMRFVHGFRTGLYFPVGGLWVRPQSNQNKCNIISLMTTQKKKAPGHQLREQIRDIYLNLPDNGYELDFFGRGSNPIEDKTAAISPYRYTIVVESHQIPGYFTEKIIDAFASYTIPIYWGDPLISRRFISTGYLAFNKIEDLFALLDSELVSEEFYERRFPYICANFKLAQRYYCAEDWIFEEYPYLFI